MVCDGRSGMHPECGCSERSVPARSRVMLAWCFSTMTAATAAAASVTNVGSCHAAAPTSASVAASEPSETSRVLHTTAMNTTTAAAAAIGASTAKAPLAVATPLPPRKRSQIGATWPTTEATAASATAPSLACVRRASQTATAPFAASASATSRPMAGVVARSALVAPTLPLPTRRRSRCAQRRTTSHAIGIEPSA